MVITWNVLRINIVHVVTAIYGYLEFAALNFKVVLTILSLVFHSVSIKLLYNSLTYFSSFGMTFTLIYPYVF